MASPEPPILLVDGIEENEDDTVEVCSDIWDPSQVTTMSPLQAKNLGLGQNILGGKKQNKTTNGTNYARTMGAPYPVPTSQVANTTPRLSTTTSQRKPIPFGLNRSIRDGRPLEPFPDGSFQGEMSKGHKRPGAGMGFQPTNTLNGQRSSQKRNRQPAFSSAEGQRNYLVTAPNAVDDDSSDELCRDPSVGQSRIQKDKSRRISPSSPAVNEYFKVERMMSPHSRKRKFDEVDIYEDARQARAQPQLPRRQREQKRQAITRAKEKNRGSEFQEITPYSALFSRGSDDRTRSHYFTSIQSEHRILSRAQSRRSSVDLVDPTIGSPQSPSQSLAERKITDRKTDTLDKTPIKPQTSDPIEIEDSPSKTLPSVRRRGRIRDQILIHEGEISWKIIGAHATRAFWSGDRFEILMDTDMKTIRICADGMPKSRLFFFKQLDGPVQYSDAYARFKFKTLPPTILWVESEDCCGLIRQMDSVMHFDNIEETDEDIWKWVTAWKREQKNWQEKNGKPPSDVLEGSVYSENQGGNLLATEIINPISQDHAHKDLQAGNHSSTQKVKLCKRLQDVNGPKATPINKDGHVLVSNSTRKRKALDHTVDEVDELAIPEGIDSYDAGIRRPKNMFKRMKAQQDLEVRRTPRNAGTTPPTRQLPARVSRTRRTYAELDTMDEPKPEKFSVVHGLGPKWTEPLVFPQEGKNRVTVEFEDLERLDEGEFLNDNLVEFALRYLRSSRNDLKNIYWFSTYFFEQLTKAKKKAINYDGVKRWTKDVDLFSYDYVVVPINENFHWYLAIICNLPALKKAALATTLIDITAIDEPRHVAENKRLDTVAHGTQAAQIAHDDDLELSINKLSMESPAHEQEDSSAKVLIPSSQSDQKVSAFTEGKKSKLQTRHPDLPTIVTLDSLGVSHSATIVALKSYLKQEAHEKFGFSWEPSDIAGMTAKGIPSQNNLSDCGLYLIKYAYAFVRDSSGFVHKLLQKELDAEKDFTGNKPTEIRTRLREEIIKLHQNQVAGDKQGSSQARKDLDESESQDLVEIMPLLGSDPKKQERLAEPSSPDPMSDLARSLDQTIRVSRNKVTKSVQHSPVRANLKELSEQMERAKHQTRGSSLPLPNARGADVQKTNSQYIAEPRNPIPHYQTTEAEEESEVPETPPPEAEEPGDQPPHIDLTSASNPVSKGRSTGFLGELRGSFGSIF